MINLRNIWKQKADLAAAAMLVIMQSCLSNSAGNTLTHCCCAGDKAVLEKAGSIIKELRKVQEALGGGYLSAFPKEHFDRLRALQQVWAPFYVVSLQAIAKQ